MLTWKVKTLHDALFAELPMAEQARPFSYFHPALRSCYRVAIENRAEWDRIGVTDGLSPAPPVPDGQPLPTATEEHIRIARMVYAANPSEEPSDIRLIHSIQKEVSSGQDTINVRCINCRLWAPPFVMVDVRALPETCEKPILARRNQPKSVTGYHPPVDLKNGAGFVCDGCWTTWVRFGWKIGGVIYTRLQHITALGAPADFISERATRPGWRTIGFGDE